MLGAVMVILAFYSRTPFHYLYLLRAFGGLFSVYAACLYACNGFRLDSLVAQTTFS